MKNLCLMLGLMCVIGCGVAKATPQPGESAASIALTYASLEHASPVVTPDGPALRCGGDKIITHGDGHTTPCPGCVDCQPKTNQRASAPALLRPALYVTRRQVVNAAPAPVIVAEESDAIELPTAVALASGSCADGSCSTATAGDCASGSCGATSGGPMREIIRARPLRSFVGRIRERKPVRRLLGRLFRRR